MVCYLCRSLYQFEEWQSKFWSLEVLLHPTADLTVDFLISFCLVGKLRAAVMTGLVVLVTNLERRRWDKSLDLLLARQTFTNDEGQVQVIIGKLAVDYHPSFCLYLSSSVPLFMPGEGLVPLPVAKTCVIDMSVSHEGVRDLLFIDTLNLERPEFDGQQRSLERDLTLHRQQVVQAKVCVYFMACGWLLFDSPERLLALFTRI